MKVGVVIPAAGTGERMGHPVAKQFITFRDVPILLRTVRTFDTHPEIGEIIIAVKEEERTRVQEMLIGTGIRKVKHVVTGGSQRQESVFNGLRYITSQWVMVHDAVRPFVTHEEISRLLAALATHKAAVLAVPVKNTIKMIDQDGNVLTTPDRDCLREIHTPQIFCSDILMEAHTQFQSQAPPASDDAMLVEQMGVSVKVIEGEYTNIKITTPEDIIIAERIHQMMYEKTC